MEVKKKSSCSSCSPKDGEGKMPSRETAKKYMETIRDGLSPEELKALEDCTEVGWFRSVAHEAWDRKRVLVDDLDQVRKGLMELGPYGRLAKVSSMPADEVKKLEDTFPDFKRRLKKDKEA